MSPLGATLGDNSGDNTVHFAALRLMLIGSGNLLMTVHSLDQVRAKTLVPFVMQGAIRVLPTRIVNFMEQRATFEFKTTQMDEKFRILRIVIYTKTVFTSYPGN